MLFRMSFISLLLALFVSAIKGNYGLEEEPGISFEILDENHRIASDENYNKDSDGIHEESNTSDDEPKENRSERRTQSGHNPLSRDTNKRKFSLGFKPGKFFSGKKPGMGGVLKKLKKFRKVSTGVVKHGVKDFGSGVIGGAGSAIGSAIGSGIVGAIKNKGQPAGETAEEYTYEYVEE